jgi:hypothetical protein
MEQDSSAGKVDLRRVHWEALRDHAIELLKMGYGALNAVAFVNAEEEEITGKLKEAIEHIIEAAPNAPRWVEHYAILEEERPSGSRKTGKRRPRIDITIKRHWKIREAHPRFRFEAKRLRADKRVTAYFGKEGLGCFLSNKYPLTHPEAAMVGYVQAGTLAEWQTRLRRYADTNKTSLVILKNGEWKEFSCALSCSAVTEHQHPIFPRISVIHLLLAFC